MVQLLEVPLWIDEECPILDISLPRVYRKPPAPIFTRGKASVSNLITRAAAAQAQGNPAEFGKTYGELTAEFQPAIEWARSCWDYLLSVFGCRFTARTEAEKLACRGDYRLFTENDFQRLVYRVFKERLTAYLGEPQQMLFAVSLRSSFWAAVQETYRSLENPPDPRERTLTPYSYLRCAPYRFLNDHHQQRVTAAIRRLPDPLRQVIELFHLRFYTEEAARTELEISEWAFRRRYVGALRTVATEDFLSSALLKQIERY